MPLPLFVYGTLMPGHLRWGMLEDHVVDQRRALAAGTVYDTGNGWPAGQFDGRPDQFPPTPAIPGWLVTVEPPDFDALLRMLDGMEGIGPHPDPERDPYERRRVRVGVPVDRSGGTWTTHWAWAWHALRIHPTWRPVDEWEGFEEH